MDGPGGGGGLGECQRGLWRGEVDHGIDLCEGRLGILGDRHAQRGAAHRLAHVAADPVMPGPFDRGGKLHLVAGGDLADQHLAHAAGGACHGIAGGLAHTLSPAVLPGIGPARVSARGALGKVLSLITL